MSKPDPILIDPRDIADIESAFDEAIEHIKKIKGDSYNLDDQYVCQELIRCKARIKATRKHGPH